MHLTRAALSIKEKDAVTNDDRPGFHRTLCRMLIALRYRTEPREHLVLRVNEQLDGPRYRNHREEKFAQPDADHT